MSKGTRTVPKFTEEAIARADKVSREDYKAIKHMSKIELVDYMDRVYRRGFEAGREAGLKEAKKEAGNG